MIALFCYLLLLYCYNLYFKLIGSIRTPLSCLVAELNLIWLHCPTGKSTDKSGIHQPKQGNSVLYINYY